MTIVHTHSIERCKEAFFLFAKKKGEMIRKKDT